MATQIGKCTVVVQARRLLQLVEHRDKSLRRKPGLRQHAETDTIRFALHVAGEIQLTLRCHRLTTGHQRSSGVGTFAGGQRSQYQCTYQPGGLLTLLGNQARNMTLCHMAELMRQHGGEFIATADDPDQTQVQTKISAWQGKRVDAAVTAKHDLPGKTLVKFRRQISAQSCRSKQGLPDRLHIVAQDGVIDIVRIAVDLTGDAVSEAPLRRRPQLAAVAQCRQLASIRRTTQNRSGRLGRPGNLCHCSQGNKRERAGRDPDHPSCWLAPQPTQWIGVCGHRTHARMMHDGNEWFVKQGFRMMRT